jgi:dipeptidyl aminopeptidase/acylaminoacyl peptidase
MQSGLWLLPITGNRNPVRFMETSPGGKASQFSPDGKWIAYASDESTRNEVYVTSFPAGGRQWQVSSKGGDYPRWRKDGQELFYVAPDRKLMSITVRATPAALEFGAPSALFSIPIPLADQGVPEYTYDVMPDGQRFLALAPTSEADSASMTVVTNWQADLSAAKR